MSRQEELLQMARLLRAQAEAMATRDVKQAFRKMADQYEKEARQPNRPDLHITHPHFPKSAA